MSNIVDPDILKDHDDITTVDYQSRENQISDDELGIETSTRLLCGELEDDVCGTAIEKQFFTCVRQFYVTVISKMLNKFPFTDNIIKELSFLDPRHRSTSSCSGIISLASRFTSFTEDELDNLSMEFRDFRSSDLPEFNPKEHAAIEHFWDAMSKVKLVNESKFETLAALAKVLLILPHSNADPERLFSMVRKIETEQSLILLLYVTY